MVMFGFDVLGDLEAILSAGINSATLHGLSPCKGH